MRTLNATLLLQLFVLPLLLLSHATAMQTRRRHVAADGSVREYVPETKSWVFLESAQQDAPDAGAPQLAIEGRRFEYNFAQGEFEINRIPIYILPPQVVRDSASQTDGDTGRTVWDAAIVLAKYMEKYPAAIEGKRILELGAGTGLAGLAAAALGARVDISDLEYCLPLIEANIKKTATATETARATENEGGSIGGGVAVARALDWTHPNFESPRDVYDIVLGADIVWLEHLVAPLVSVMEELLLLNTRLKILLAHQTRSAATDAVLFDLLANKFVVSSVEKPEGFQDTRVNLFELQALKHSGGGKKVDDRNERCATPQ